MSLTEWIRVAGWVVLAFVISVLFDMGFQYRVQLAAGPALSGDAEPRFGTKPAFRHILIFLMCCLGAYLYRKGVKEWSPSLIAWFVMLIVYGALLLYDSLRDLKQRRTDRSARDGAAERHARGAAWRSPPTPQLYHWSSASTLNWFPWAQAIVSAAFTGLGIFQLVVGYAVGIGRTGITRRSDSPYTYWFLTGTCFVIAIIFAVSCVKDYLEDRGSDDAEP